MNCEEIRDLILFLAANVAEADETNAVRAHLGTGCPRCAGRLAEAEAILSHLPLALEPIPPSPSVRARLMERIAADEGSFDTRRAPSERRDVPPDDRMKAPHAPSRKRLTAKRGAFSMLVLRPALAAAIAAGAVGLAVFIPMQRDRVMLRAELSRQERRLEAVQTELRDATAAIRMIRSPAVLVVSLSGAAPQPRAAGRIFWDRSRREGRFYVTDLKPAGPGRIYQLWFITDKQQKVPAGTFDVNEAGEGELRAALPGGTGPIALAAVTDEPEGGSTQPTGRIHLTGRMPEEAS